MKVLIFDNDEAQIDFLRTMAYVNYKNELMKYNDNMHACSYFNNRWAAHYHDLMSDKDIKRLSVADNNNSEIGFFVVRNGDSAKKLGVDYYIEDVYLLPQFRGKGFMENFAKEFFKTHPGRYGMELISKNKNATEFWRSVINDNEWEKIPTTWYGGNKIFYFKKEK